MYIDILAIKIKYTQKKQRIIIPIFICQMTEILLIFCRKFVYGGLLVTLQMLLDGRCRTGRTCGLNVTEKVRLDNIREMKEAKQIK